jgi:hypothetical protein
MSPPMGGPLTHALIGGVQPRTGWWAPVTQRYIDGVGTTVQGTRFATATFLHSLP